MARLKRKLYTVNARIIVMSAVEVPANSMEEALQQARSLSIGDFVEVIGSHDDSTCVITGVAGPEHFNTDQNG